MKTPNLIKSAIIAAALTTTPTFAEETKATTTTTQTGVATALATKDDTSNTGKIKQVNHQALKFLDVSKLVFPKDVKVLTDEATKFGLKFEVVDDEKKFKSLQGDVNIAQAAQNITPEQLAKFKQKLETSNTKEELESMMKELKEFGVVVEFDFGESPSNIRLKSCKKRINTALVQLNTAHLIAKGKRLEEDTKIIRKMEEEKRAEIKQRVEKL